MPCIQSVNFPDFIGTRKVITLSLLILLCGVGPSEILGLKADNLKLLHRMKNNIFFNRLCKIGANTLAIFLLQSLILQFWLNRTVDFPDMNIWIYNLIVMPLISLAIIGICIIIIKFVQRSKYAELLLFGKK